MGQIKQILGDNIRRLRVSKGWTQVYLADVLELTPSFFTLVESGQRGMSLEVIEATAKVFDVPVASLFIEHNNTSKVSDDAPLLRNAELLQLKQKLLQDIQKSLNESIDALIVE
ncbi:MAG: helix-turn-helix transcriptional regulator [Spirochaetaceae bacterium]|nr:helix-turn-helix transcriptional regulator [Spirochaetaceae bacterium]MBO6101396.1 helix-turn-helix transcriptional regulator [Spirochaetaceae bacterium]